MKRLLHLIMLVLGTLPAIACAVTPGGLVSSHNSGAGIATSMSMTMTVEKEPPSTTNLFWAQQFFLDASIDHGGYFGMQTGGIIEGFNVGKVFIFSIWNATAAEPAPGWISEPFGGEGVGYTMKKQVAWQEGVPYLFTLEKDVGLYWKMSVTTPGQPAEYAGRIRITEDVGLRSFFAAFTEYFVDVPNCAGVPFARAAFSPVSFNGATIPAFDSLPTDGPCKSIARGTLRAGGVAVHEIGPTIFTLDVTADAKYDALSDGLITLRYLFGLSGQPLVTGALLDGSGRIDPAWITAHLGNNRLQLDVDGDGASAALTDGLLMLRYLFGLRGTGLTAGAVALAATRKTPAEIESYLATLVP